MIDDAPPPATSPGQPINQVQRTTVTWRWGTTLAGDWPALSPQLQAAPMPSIVQTGPCRCPVCRSRSSFLPTLAIDPAGLRAFLVVHATTSFNVMKGSVCAVAKYLNVEHGPDLVVYMRDAVIKHRMYALPSWTVLLIGRLTDRTRPYRTGAEVVAEVVAVLRDLRMPLVVTQPAEVVTEDDVEDTVSLLQPGAPGNCS